MHMLKIGAAALAATFVLAAGCSKESAALKPVKTTEAELEKLADKLRAENHVEKGGAAVDMAGVFAALPKEIKVTYDSSALDPASGATVLKAVKITPTDMPNLGVSIAELKLWAFDAEFAKARLSGQRLAEAKKLASRIEADGISAFGLEAIMSPILDAEKAVIQGAGVNDPAVAAALDVKPGKYTFSVDKMIYDDVQLRPYELVPAKLAADNPFASAMPVLQGYTAIARSLAFDTAAIYGLKGEVGMEQMGAQSDVVMGIESMAYRGWRGWDADLGLMKNMNYVVKMTPLAAPATPGAPASPVPPVDITENIAKVSVAGMRLDKVMGYLARGQMPPRTEADIMSIGVMNIEGTTMAMSGKPLGAIGKMTMDLSHWHWLIPNAGRLSIDNMTYDVKAFIDFANETAKAAAGPGEPAAPIPLDPQIMATLAKYGLDKPSLDFGFGWNWDTKAGATTVDLAFGLDGYDRVDVKVDLILPGFDPVSALIPDKGEPNEQALQKLFTDTFRFKGAAANLIDEGGLEKGFALASALAPLLPADDPGMATFRNMKPDQLRGMASNGAYLMADTAAQQFPPAKDLLRPFAAWVTQGGKVHVKVQPKTPLTAKQLEAAGNDPNVVTVLGVTVTHEPPPGAPKPKT